MKILNFQPFNTKPVSPLPIFLNSGIFIVMPLIVWFLLISFRSAASALTSTSSPLQCFGWRKILFHFYPILRVYYARILLTKDKAKKKQRTTLNNDNLILVFEFCYYLNYRIYIDKNI